jgi:hypothetical protein
MSSLVVDSELVAMGGVVLAFVASVVDAAREQSRRRAWHAPCRRRLIETT